MQSSRCCSAILGGVQGPPEPRHTPEPGQGVSWLAPQSMMFKNHRMRLAIADGMQARLVPTQRPC
jgi:hypothetical protein